MSISNILNRLHHFVAAIRLPLYKMRHNSFGKDNFITEHVLLHSCKFGNYNYIGNYSILNNVEMGNYCSIAPNCIIGGEEHAYWDLSTSDRVSRMNISNKKTIIGHDVWCGAGVFIRQGVTIGNGAVIGAHSVVLTDVEPYSIVVGTPAKFLKKLFPNTIIQLLQEHSYYDMPQKEAREFIDQLHKDYSI